MWLRASQGGGDIYIWSSREKRWGVNRQQGHFLHYLSRTLDLRTLNIYTVKGRAFGVKHEARKYCRYFGEISFTYLPFFLKSCGHLLWKWGWCGYPCQCILHHTMGRHSLATQHTTVGLFTLRYHGWSKDSSLLPAIKREYHAGQENIRILNSKYGFYRMHITVAPA
jgi:hypothetical protein